MRAPQGLASPPWLGQMEGYVAIGRAGVGTDGRAFARKAAGRAAPSGVSLGQMSAQGIWSEMADTLSLPRLGTFTMWAVRTGDMSWSPVLGPPAENTEVFSLTDRQIVQAEEVAYGDALPYVAILSAVPSTMTQLETAFGETAYRYYRTDAVFRQDDTDPVPRIYFLHWGERIDSANAPQHLQPLEAAALVVDGALVFALDVTATETTSREFPAMGFQLALESQFAVDNAPVVGPVRTASPEMPVIASVTPEYSWVGPAILGIVTGTAVWALFGRK